MSEPIFLFRSQIQSRRFNAESLRILESVLVSKDVKSLIETRSRLKEFMRTESVTVLKLNEGNAVVQKLSVVEFFMRAFALVGDAESCLALKYEALNLRELECMNHPLLQVSYEEWLRFADDSRRNGFYSIAIKGYDNAIECLHRINSDDSRSGSSLPNTIMVDEIKELRDKARMLIASRSVQAQTAEYLRSRALLKQECEIQSPKAQPLASSLFRWGIKRRNFQKLQNSRIKKFNSS
ncbi:protein DOUBLE-STRAND BREAK FORMATION [Aristolochia californica]|uniref:protein DOUBLE-STRAND BREAK FORMATION n=1 Tax=Aristolochia californica TaxID=171875 RepID=UPI0035DB22EA